MLCARRLAAGPPRSRRRTGRGGTAGVVEQEQEGRARGTEPQTKCRPTNLRRGGRIIRFAMPEPVCGESGAELFKTRSQEEKQQTGEL